MLSQTSGKKKTTWMLHKMDVNFQLSLHKSIQYKCSEKDFNKSNNNDNKSQTKAIVLQSVSQYYRNLIFKLPLYSMHSSGFFYQSEFCRHKNKTGKVLLSCNSSGKKQIIIDILWITIQVRTEFPAPGA